MQSKVQLPEGPVSLKDAHVPGVLVGRSEALVKTDLAFANGKFVADSGGQSIDLAGQMVLPSFVDMHTHLDKGHIWPRKPNPDGTFAGALSSVGEDRTANWSADDLRARMEFALQSAYAHGTKTIRTHIDSIAPQHTISWPVFAEMRDRWAGKVDLQGVCLVGVDGVDAHGDTTYGPVAKTTIEHGGILGMVPYPIPDISERITNLFAIARKHGSEVDLHVDETGDPSVNTLKIIAQEVIRSGFEHSVVCGHCCSLAVMPDSEADETMDLVAKAGIHIVSLPMCNLYLQDRVPGRTPRWRGVTLVHELKARGVKVSFASDNTRDPFYAFGDLDMVEVMREATRIAHLDHTSDDWVEAFTSIPASVCGFDYEPFAQGAAADFTIFNARSWNEFLSRPQTDRTVIRDGRALSEVPKAYSELDPLMEI